MKTDVKKIIESIPTIHLKRDYSDYENGFSVGVCDCEVQKPLDNGNFLDFDVLVRKFKKVSGGISEEKDYETKAVEVYISNIKLGDKNDTLEITNDEYKQAELFIKNRLDISLI